MKKIFTLCLLLSTCILRAQTDGFTPVCVDSVWYDSINPNIINVSIYNGGAVNLNYPSVQIVDPNGDTISNESNYVMFFAQLTNTYTIYTDTISVTGITDFSGYTFVMNENFGSSNFNMSICFPTSVSEANESLISTGANPVADWLSISGLPEYAVTYRLFSSNGKLIDSGIIGAASGRISTVDLVPGTYFINLQLKGSAKSLLFMKM